MKRISTLILAGLMAASLTQIPAASFAATATVAVSPSDASEISTAYDHLTTDFYKKVDPQVVLDSVRTELLAAMRTAGVKNASLPVMHASGLANANTHAIDHEVSTAAGEAGSKISPHVLSYVALDGMLNAVHDRYTVFLSPKEYAGLNSDLDGGDFGGTGIVIQIDEATKLISVSNVVPDGPADKAGVQQDDLITAIDGTSTKGLTIQQASSKLRGKEGTSVTLSIQRSGAAIAPVALTRAKIHQLSVYGKMLPGKIGYVALTVFGRDTGAELDTALGRLQQQGARAVIMDLRGNGGGYLNAAVDVSSKFIPSGPIVSVESRASNITTLEANNTAIDPLPLVVLVDKYTASASEITSGAIQDDGVGELVGEKTYGKGVVQTIHPLPDGSAVKITSARYLTPKGRDINLIGIQPDIVSIEPKTSKYGDPTTDPQLQSAITYLQGKIAQTGM